ncbi:glycosyltransferase family 4 protein [Solemya elarraichensis gill symbiont]|uniref:Glycosyl transferase family 1 n=1 Tax=Solemya elarraichensis gill symbiont TaxID=1918949 RepID=A0A1T2L784_9GAMM|nr:glycosyltransferase family 1 protein [Solemya elarraichensis gill symbiont]OOZ40920.1 hypothetical protein BOW52_05210 [Solemya elarraichensis gill symbiont]
MRVGLNATCLNDRPSGAKQRFIGIYGAFFEQLPEVQFVIYEPRDCSVHRWFDALPNLAHKETPIPSEGRFGKYASGKNYWPRAFRKDAFDIFEGFHIPLVRSPSGKTIMTIHDVRGLRDDVGMLSRAAFKAVLRKSLQNADHVVTVSDAMKQEILDFYPGADISVIYNGLDAGDFSRINEQQLTEFKNNNALPDSFALAVGHFEPRKNYLHLIDAIALLKQRGFDVPLLIIGNNSGERERVETRIEKAGLSSQVTIMSGLSDEEVRCAYQLCSLFICPSSYEGFGIPMLEAMAAQRPMVLSDLPVFREITEDQSVYFDANNVEAMANAIEVALTDTLQRTKMIEYGNERIRDFSFDKLAGQLADTYKALLYG